MPSPGSSGPTNQHGPLPHSLESHGDEGHGHHHQVQDVEVVAAEGALVQEGPVGGHLGGEAACWGGAGLGTRPWLGAEPGDTPLVGGAWGHSPLVGVEPGDTRPLVGGAWGHSRHSDTQGTAPSSAPGSGTAGTSLGQRGHGNPGSPCYRSPALCPTDTIPLPIPPPLPPPPSSFPSSPSSSFLLLPPPPPSSSSSSSSLESVLVVVGSGSTACQD